ncbi:MAG: archease [Candidatus Nanoarchaeia archaeon]
MVVKNKKTKLKSKKASKKTKGKEKIKYRFLEKFVTADVAFEAFGKKLDELFKNAALALTETMVDSKTIEPKIQKMIKLQNKELAQLLIDFLNELVYYKDAEALLFSKIEVQVKNENNIWKLAATLKGEQIDWKRHKLKADVKAATWHLFELQEEKEGWRTRVVLDI